MKPFRFFSRLHLRQLLGLSACTISELLEHLKNVPGSSIYHHTHHFLEQHQGSVPAYPNDFAYWISEMIGARKLGERLGAIDTVAAPSIRALRERIVSMIEEELVSAPDLTSRRAPKGEAFYFVKAMSFIFPTEHEAHDLKEFRKCLKEVTMTTMYYHAFESRLHFEKPTNDFSHWLRNELRKEELAQKFERFDPYAHSLQGLRAKMIEMVRKG